MHALAVHRTHTASATSVSLASMELFCSFFFFLCVRPSRATFCESWKLVWYGGRPSMCHMHTKPIKVKCTWPQNWINFDGNACARRPIFWQQLSTDDDLNYYYIYLLNASLVLLQNAHTVRVPKTIDGRNDRQKINFINFLFALFPACLRPHASFSQLRKFRRCALCAKHKQNHNNSPADWCVCWARLRYITYLGATYLHRFLCALRMHFWCFAITRKFINSNTSSRKSDERTNEQTNATPHARSRRASEIFMNRPSWCTRHVIFNAKSYDANEM